MKKKIITFCLAAITAFSLTGCGEKVTNEYGQEVYAFGPYVQISTSAGRDQFNNRLTFYTVYHQETKEMFELLYNHADSVFSIRQIWNYDEEGHPVVKYYEGEYVK